MADRGPRIHRAPLQPTLSSLCVAMTSSKARHSFRPRSFVAPLSGLGSGFYARNESDIDDLAGDQLERFPLLRLYRPAVWEAAGIEIVPTFRTPHMTIAFDGEVGLQRLRVADHDERNNRTNLTEEVGDMTTALDVDLRIDFNTMDETGLPWTFLDQAPDPSRIIPGRHIVVGSGAAVAVAVVVDITDEGIVHV